MNPVDNVITKSYDSCNVNSINEEDPIKKIMSEFKVIDYKEVYDFILEYNLVKLSEIVKKLLNKYFLNNDHYLRVYRDYEIEELDCLKFTVKVNIHKENVSDISDSIRKINKELFIIKNQLEGFNKFFINAEVL